MAVTGTQFEQWVRELAAREGVEVYDGPNGLEVPVEFMADHFDEARLAWKEMREKEVQDRS